MATQTGRALSENIAFLSQFAKYLEEPTTNQLPSSLASKKVSDGRCLTLEQEKKLVETFALLLATASDTTRVGAVCVEESRDGTGIIVRSTINTGIQEPRRATFRRLINAVRLESKSSVSYLDSLVTEKRQLNQV
jgi:hypothetical protein